MKRTGFVFSGLLVIVSVLGMHIDTLQAEVVITGDVRPPLPWSTSTNAFVGYVSYGTLTVDGGSHLYSYNASLGGLNRVISWGEATVTGTGSTWTVIYTLTVGRGTSGRLNVENGGQVASAHGEVGVEGQGEVTISGSDSNWTIYHTLRVGIAGNGVINIQNGGHLSSASAVVTGGEWAGSAMVYVTGSGSQWTLSEDLFVGMLSFTYSRLFILNGGQLSCRSAYLAYPNWWSNCHAEVEGTGSRWTISEDLCVGAGGVKISDGGTISVGRTVVTSGSGSLSLDGGTLDAPTIDDTKGGTKNFRAGTLRFGTYLGNLTNAGATVRSRDGVFGMRVNGNYTQGADAKLLIEIAGPPESGLFDVLTVTGPANLAGTLALDFSAYVPPEPATYKFLNAPTITGTFNSYEVIGLDPSLVSFNIPAGEFTVVPEPTTLGLLLAAGVCLLPYARRKRN